MYCISLTTKKKQMVTACVFLGKKKTLGNLLCLLQLVLQMPTILIILYFIIQII